MPYAVPENQTWTVDGRIESTTPVRKSIAGDALAAEGDVVVGQPTAKPLAFERFRYQAAFAASRRCAG